MPTFSAPRGVTAAALALLVAGCGGDETPTPASDAGPSKTGDAASRDGSTARAADGSGVSLRPDASEPGQGAPDAEAPEAGAPPHPAADAGPDGRTPTLPPCESGPFITETVFVKEMYGADVPLPNITVAVEPCGVVRQTGADGKASFAYPATLPHYYRVSGAGFTPSFWMQARALVAGATTNLFALGPAFLSVGIPDYDPTKSEILVKMGVIPPAMNDGVTLTVPGVPGAKITQWLGKVGTDRPTTILHGLTTIIGLPASGLVTVVASKPGHTVVIDSLSFSDTGKFPVETGAITYVDAVVHN